MSGQFQCSNGQCVDQTLRCDGHGDCRDHSDERGCSHPPPCPPQLRCPQSDECLLQEWLCDGDEDCSDGSDERVRGVEDRVVVACGGLRWKTEDVSLVKVTSMESVDLFDVFFCHCVHTISQCFKSWLFM